MNRSTTKPSYLISSFRSFTACSSSPFFLPTVPPLSPSSRLTDDSDSSIILEHVFYCQTIGSGVSIPHHPSDLCPTRH